MRAFEAEEIKKTGKDLDKVVVGEIVKIKKHPNADKLQVVKVDIKNKKLNIVCGAYNIAIGQKVPVALAGAKLPGGLEIKKAEIRGVKSYGMLCAEDELGLGSDHSGILILDEKLKTGMNLAEALKLDDAVIDLDILSNRGHDALSHIGIAREICALENRSCEWLRMGKQINANGRMRIDANANGNLIDVDIEDEKLCPRYIGAVMKNIEIKESPSWIKSRLITCGISPVNNVVDAANYVMLELGQPLHAFNRDAIESEFPISNFQFPNKSKSPNFKLKKIVIRNAKKGEKIKLLDGMVAELIANDLVIADSEKALAVAGIMGGLDSGVSPKTKNIFLEAANFNPMSIRKTRMRLGIKTESSDRFERELDPNLAEKGMARLIEIISETAGGKLESVKDIYPKKVLPWKIKLDLAYLNRLLGEDISPKIVKKILENLELRVTSHESRVEAEIPTFRIDLKTQEDLIEEIGRIYGYEKIKPRPPLAPVKPAKANDQKMFEREVKNILAGGGFSEVCNYSFYGVKDAGLAGLGAVKHLELENPMNPNQALMRISLIPNLLKNIRDNLRNYKEFNIFEVGRVYWPNSEVLPEERTMLAGAVVANSSKKGEDSGAESFYLAKGYVDHLLSRLGVMGQYYDDFNSSPLETFRTLWHESRSAEIKIEGREKAVGYLGEINPFVSAQFGIRQRVAMFEFDMGELKKISETEREYAPISKYPTIVRDISMIVDKGVKISDVLTSIQASGGDLVLDVDLFDIFENEKEGVKSLAFHIVFGLTDRTLESQEADELMEKIIADLEKNLKVKVRK